MKRFISFLLAAMMLLTCVSALAASDWDCDCGAKGNTSSFCPDCGAAKPKETKKTTVSSNSKVKVGSYVKFGHYDQDGNDVNGKEAIQWLVLAVDGDKALLISRRGLHNAKFNSTSTRETWATCDLRTWLNKKFLNQAFTSSEREYILTTHVDEDISQCDPAHEPNRLGKDTDDKVFLLSYAEALKYMPTEEERMCRPTTRAINEGGNKSDKRYIDNEYRTCWYWLRSPAYNNNVCIVGWEGELDTCYMSHDYGVVRPCIWVDIAGLQ